MYSDRRVFVIYERRMYINGERFKYYPRIRNKAIQTEY